MKLFFTVCFLGLFVGFALLFNEYANDLLAWIKSLGWAAPILFCLFYIVATILFMPTLVITFAGGAVFGPFWGTLLNLTGATLGATIAFCISRYFSRTWLNQYQSTKFSQLVGIFDRRGWTFLAFLRVVPIIPFNIVNYGFGLSKMRLRDYALITTIFLTPAEIVYTGFGFAGSHVFIKGAVLSPMMLGSIVGIGVLFFGLVFWLQKHHRLSNW